MTLTDSLMLLVFTALGAVVFLLIIVFGEALTPAKPLLSPYAVQHYTKDGGLIENYPIKGLWLSDHTKTAP